MSEAIYVFLFCPYLIWKKIKRDNHEKIQIFKQIRIDKQIKQIGLMFDFATNSTQYCSTP